MAKKENDTHKIPESELMLLMAGEIPRAKGSSAKDAESEQQERTAVSVPEPVESETADTPKAFSRRKKLPQDYASTFLAPRASAARRQTYISDHIYVKMTNLLPVISGEISITVYIDNILSHHLENYRDEIEEIFARNSKFPL